MNIDHHESSNISPLDARPGDHLTFITDETGERFHGLILARELSLAQVRALGYHVRNWREAERVARRLIQRH